MTMRSATRQLFIFELLVCLCTSLQEVNPGTGGGNVACKEACRQTFAGRSYVEAENNQGFLEDSCERGCRFYAIVELLNKNADHAHNLNVCYDNCHDAYLSFQKENEACTTGCDHQHPFKMKKSELDLEVPQARGPENIKSVLYPVLQIHNLYRSMRKASWSFFAIQRDTGTSGDIVIVQTQPLRHHSMFGRENSLASGRSGMFGDSPSQVTWNWLTCLPQSSGMPGMFLLILLLLPAMALVWLCVSAAETAPEQHVKLAIHLDAVDSNESLKKKDGLFDTNVQEPVSECYTSAQQVGDGPALATF